MKREDIKIKAGVFLVAALFLATTISSTANAAVYHYPVYHGDSSFPAQLQPGDLLFMDAKPWIIHHFNVPHVDNDNGQKSNDHVVIYIGVENNVNMFIETNNYTVFLNAVNFTLPGGSGVQKTPWWIFYFWAENFTIGKVTNATSQQKQEAIDHANSLLGLGYQSAFSDYPPYFIWSDPNITDPANPYYHERYYYPSDPVWGNKYFCAELVHACYLWATPSPINIDPYPASDGTYDGHPAWKIYPRTLLDSKNMTFIEVTETNIIPIFFLQNNCNLFYEMR